MRDVKHFCLARTAVVMTLNFVRCVKTPWGEGDSFLFDDTKRVRHDFRIAASVRFEQVYFSSNCEASAGLFLQN